MKDKNFLLDKRSDKWKSKNKNKSNNNLENKLSRNKNKENNMTENRHFSKIKEEKRNNNAKCKNNMKTIVKWQNTFNRKSRMKRILIEESKIFKLCINKTNIMRK